MLCTADCSRVNSKSTKRCFFRNFYTYVDFFFHSRYEFRDFLLFTQFERVMSQLLNEQGG